MDISFEQYQQIQQYLDKTMPDDDIAAFELLLEADNLLKENFLFEKKLRKNLERMNEDADMENYDYTPQKKGNSPLDDPLYMRKLIEDAGKNFRDQQNINNDIVADTPVKDLPVNKNDEKTGKIISMNTFMRLAVAACVILVVAGTVWYTISRNNGANNIANNNNTIDTPGIKKQQDQIAHSPGNDTVNKINQREEKLNLASLFKEFFRKDEAPVDEPQLLAYVLADYTDNHYKTLQQLNIENLPTSRDANNSEAEDRRVRELAHYYKGISHLMQNGSIHEAITNLQWTVDSSTNADLKVKAQWYLALAFLKDNNTGKAKFELKQLAADNAGVYKTEAMALLKRMEE